jgi:type I restriction enzyme, S subunit
VNVPTFALGAVATIDRTSVLPGAMQGKYVGLEHINASGEICTDHSIGTEKLASSKFLFSQQHVLFGKLRPYLRKVARPQMEGVCSTDILPILPRKGLDRDYLYHYLRSPEVIDLATRRSSGANLPRISPAALAEFLIPLPPLNEQKRIAAILDKAEAIRRKREQVIQLADEFLRSLFLDIFGEPVRNSKGWPLRPLRDMFAKSRAGTRCGPFGSSLRKDEYQQAGIPVWGIDNVLPNRFHAGPKLFISEKKFDELGSFSVIEGDILISRAGTVGRMCVVDQPVGPSIIGTNLIRLSLDEELLRPECFAAMFTFFADRFTRMRANAKTEAYSFMNTGVLAALELPIPDMKMQQRYVSAQKTIRTFQSRLEGLKTESEIMTRSITERVFNGTL